MTLKLITSLSPLLLLAACGGNDKAPANLRYACDNGTVAEVAFSPARDVARLEIGALSYDLKAIAADDGEKYSDGQVVYSAVGDKATITGIDFGKSMACSLAAE